MKKLLIVLALISGFAAQAQLCGKTKAEVAKIVFDDNNSDSFNYGGSIIDGDYKDHSEYFESMEAYMKHYKIGALDYLDYKFEDDTAGFFGEHGGWDVWFQNGVVVKHVFEYKDGPEVVCDTTI